MNSELDAKLCADHPMIFRDRNAPVELTPMGFGFECGDGWYKLIDKLCCQIDMICKASGGNVHASQVKEKFGGLRFYWGGEGLDEWYDIVDACISFAEMRAEQTCEACGEWGEIKSENKWLSCRCDKCREKKNEKTI